MSETDKKMWNLYTEADKQKLLQDIQTRKAEIKSTLIYELTHSAYTIKDEYGMGEKHKGLMNISIIKNFVRKQLDVLPPARNQEENNLSTLNSKRNDFINEMSNNGEFRKLQPLQATKERNQSLEEITKQISNGDER